MVANENEKEKKKRGNPNWVAGQSANPAGRRKQTEVSKAISSRLERWFKRRMSVQELDKIYSALESKPSEQAAFYQAILPYLTPKKSTVDISGTIEVETIVGMQFAAPKPIERTKLPSTNEAIKQQADSNNQSSNLKTENEENDHSDIDSASEITEEAEAEIMQEQSDKPTIKPKIIEGGMFSTSVSVQEQRRLNRERSERMNEFKRINNTLNDF
jgi:hypothetical protein